MQSTTIRKAGTTVALLAALSTPLVLADSAQAKGGGGGVQSRGACVGGGTFALKAKHDSGRIEVQYEVDTNRVGQVWSVRITDNGVLVYAGNNRTAAPSGSFSVSRLITDRVGTDSIRAQAVRGTRSCGGAVAL